MTVGTLVKNRHDGHRGIVMEIGPEQTRTEHGKRCARSQWFDGYETIEFISMLEVLSESTSQND